MKKRLHCYLSSIFLSPYVHNSPRISFFFSDWDYLDGSKIIGAKKFFFLRPLLSKNVISLFTGLLNQVIQMVLYGLVHKDSIDPPFTAVYNFSKVIYCQGVLY